MSEVLSRVRISPELVALIVLLLALAVVGSITSPGFLAFENALSIIRAASLVGIVAIGLTFITVSGNMFSLSVEQTAAFCGVSLALLVRAGVPAVLAVVLVLIFAAVIGLIQALAVASGANTILVTLAAGAGLAGLSGIISGGEGLSAGHALDLFATPVLGIALPIWAFVLVLLLAALLLNRHRAGIRLMLVGSNRETAEANGFRLWRTAALAFIASSVTAAIVAVLTVAQFDRAAVDQFNGLTFDALAAVLVAGTAMSGGNGSAVRTALGALFIATLSNVMVLQGFSLGLRLTIQGVVVAVAVVAFHVLRQTRRGSL